MCNYRRWPVYTEDCTVWLHGLPSYFQQVMSEIVFKDIETFGVETFLDDIDVNATNFEDFLARLREVFTRLRQWELRLNGGKTTLGGSECVYLGHHVDGEGFKHLERRFEALKKYSTTKIARGKIIFGAG